MEGLELLPVAATAVGLFSGLEISVVTALLLRISTFVVDITVVPVVLSVFKTEQEKELGNHGSICPTQKHITNVKTAKNDNSM